MLSEARSSAGVPSKAFWPRSSTNTRWATARIASTFCSTISRAMPVAVERHERRVDLVDEARGQRRRRLVEQQETRADDEGARDGEQALLAPGQRAGCLAAAVAEQWKAGVDVVDRVALVGARDGVAAEHEVVVHGHLREQPARLGEVADPQRMISSGRRPAISRPSSTMRPAKGGR